METVDGKAVSQKHDNNAGTLQEKYPGLQRLFGVGLAILAPIIWGACFVTNKIGLDYFASTAQVFIQLLASIIFLSIVLFFRRPVVIRWRELAGIASLGVLEPGLTYYFGQAGLETANAGIASIIFSSEATVTIILISLIGMEKLKWDFFLLSVLSFIGILLVIGIGQETLHFANYKGEGLVFLGVLAASFYAIASARTIGEQDPFLVVFAQQVVALIFMAMMLAFDNEPVMTRDAASIPMFAWMNIVISGIAQFSIAFSIFMVALKRINTSLVSVYLNIMPLAGIAAAYFVLGEVLKPLGIFGAGITLVALLIISVKQARLQAA